MRYRNQNSYANDPRWLTIKYACHCAACDAKLERGQSAFYYPSSRQMYGAECCSKAKDSAADFAARKQDEDMMNGGYNG